MTTVNKLIKDALKEKMLIMGAREIWKHVKRGEVRTIIHSSTLPASFKRDLDYYTRMTEMEVKPFKGDALMLGQACGKPFKIGAVAIRKE